MLIALLGIRADELLNLRIPFQFQTGAQRDDSQVRYHRGFVAGLNVANGILPRPYAIEKVAHVVLACVEPYGTFGERALNEFRVTGLQVAAVHPDPSTSSLKTNPVALSIGIFHSAKNVVCLGSADIVHHAVAVGEFDFVFAERRVAARDGVGEGFGLTATGPGRPTAQRAMSL